MTGVRGMSDGCHSAGPPACDKPRSSRVGSGRLRRLGQPSFPPPLRCGENDGYELRRLSVRVDLQLATTEISSEKPMRNTEAPDGARNPLARNQVQASERTRAKLRSSPERKFLSRSRLPLRSRCCRTRTRPTASARSASPSSPGPLRMTPAAKDATRTSAR